MSCFTPASVVGAANRPGPEQHGHGIGGAETLRISLGGDLEAAEVRRQEQHARALPLAGFDVFGPDPLHRHRPAQPQARQLSHELAGFTHRGQRHAARVTGLCRVGKQAPPVTAGQRKAQPAQTPAQRMQHGQGQPAQNTKETKDQQGHRQ
jgi:hypothetical protein